MSTRERSRRPDQVVNIHRSRQTRFDPHLIIVHFRHGRSEVIERDEGFEAEVGWSLPQASPLRRSGCNAQFRGEGFSGCSRMNPMHRPSCLFADAHPARGSQWGLHLRSCFPQGVYCTQPGFKVVPTSGTKGHHFTKRKQIT